MENNMKLRLKIVEKFRSQTRFAYELGEEEAVVSRVVNGWRKLSPEKQAQWARALGCAVADIFTREEELHAGQ